VSFYRFAPAVAVAPPRHSVSGSASSPRHGCARWLLRRGLAGRLTVDCCERWGWQRRGRRWRSQQQQQQLDWSAAGECERLAEPFAGVVHPFSRSSRGESVELELELAGWESSASRAPWTGSFLVAL